MGGVALIRAERPAKALRLGDAARSMAGAGIVTTIADRAGDASQVTGPVDKPFGQLGKENQGKKARMLRRIQLYILQLGMIVLAIVSMS
mgnify:CR=1 FL=1|tara:strand:+ start:3262 stop:3528 length:267 start_codon:yes stop_codon:yes gene_type:complete